MNRFSYLLGAIIAFGLISSMAAAQSVGALESAHNQDILPMTVGPVVIDAVDQRSSIVRIGGNQYRLLSDSAMIASSSMTADQALSIKDLTPGMEVMIETDGTEPSRSNQPFILSIWSQ